MKSSVPSVLAVALLLGACTDQAAEVTAPGAAIDQVQQRTNHMAKDRYIVVFHDAVRNVAALADRLVAEHGGKIHYRYEHALKGFAASLSPQAAEALGRNPNVKYIHPDAVVRAANPQYNPPWGLDRIDQLDLPLSGSFTWGSTGLGVRAYVIDSGIHTAHPEFGGRATVGFDAFGANGQDCNGHGTHVAGIVGAATYGVAKAASLVSVRVLDCGGWGSVAGAIAGVDWVRANAVRPAVANLSLTVHDPAGGTTGLDDAVANLIASGVTAVVAAAQTQANAGTATPGRDACEHSPARVAQALTVAASTATDSRVINGTSSGFWWTSNFGPCVDLFAPGDTIRSTWLNDGNHAIGGTSMAAPHVAGFAARYLQSATTASPADVASYILSWSANGKILNAGPSTTTNLLYTGHKRRACCSY